MRLFYKYFFLGLLFMSCSDIYFSEHKPLNSIDKKNFSPSIVGSYITPSRDTILIKDNSIIFPFGNLIYENDFKMFTLNNQQFISFKFKNGWQYVGYEKRNDTLEIRINKSNQSVKELNNISKINGNTYLIGDISLKEFTKIKSHEFFDEKYLLKKINK